MAAAFGSGVLFSIVSGMGTPNPVVNAITTGMAFAVFQGGFFIVSKLYMFPVNESHFVPLELCLKVLVLNVLAYKSVIYQ